MAEKLNVLLISIDGARPDHLGCYGHTRETTPFLDRVAREGVRFTSAFTTAPWSLAAHASLLTGLFTSTHGASHEHPSLDAGPATLAEVLGGAGYRTAAFSSDPWINPARGFGRGFDHFHTLLGDGRSIARAAFYARRATDRILRRSDDGARRANLALFDWLGASEQPFFALVHYGEPRLKRQPPSAYERMFLSPDVPRGQVRAVERAWMRDESAAEEANGDAWRILDAVYEGALRYIDDRVEELARHLESRDLWDRTVVLLVADHGQDLGEHAATPVGLGLHDTVLRVPLLLRSPTVPQGFVVDEIAQHVDVAPTLLHAVGVEAPAAMQGRALIRDGKVTAGPGFAVAERFRPGLRPRPKREADGDLSHLDVRERVLRTRREKFVWRSDERNELYDIVADPAERTNLIHEGGARGARLRAQLFDWLSSIERHQPQAPPVREDAVRQQA